MRPPRPREVVLTLAAAGLLCGCGGERQPPSGHVGAEGPAGVVRGMSQAEVLARMGGQAQALQMSGQARNPFRREVRRASDGRLLQVLFYYSGARRGDDLVSDDELAPVVLEDGRVIGWGWDFLRGLESESVPP